METYKLAVEVTPFGRSDHFAGGSGAFGSVDRIIQLAPINVLEQLSKLDAKINQCSDNGNTTNDFSNRTPILNRQPHIFLHLFIDGSILIQDSSTS